MWPLPSEARTTTEVEHARLLELRAKKMLFCTALLSALAVVVQGYHDFPGKYCCSSSSDSAAKWKKTMGDHKVCGDMADHLGMACNFRFTTRECRCFDALDCFQEGFFGGTSVDWRCARGIHSKRERQNVDVAQQGSLAAPKLPPARCSLSPFIAATADLFDICLLFFFLQGDTGCSTPTMDGTWQGAPGPVFKDEPDTGAVSNGPEPDHVRCYNDITQQKTDKRVADPVNPGVKGTTDGPDYSFNIYAHWSSRV